jgi:hypothetical protein
MVCIWGVHFLLGRKYVQERKDLLGAVTWVTAIAGAVVF